MRASRLLIAALTLLLVGCGAITTRTVRISTAVAPLPATRTVTQSVTTVPATTATAPAPQPVYFQGAAGPAAQRPHSLELTGDGTLAVEQVQWTSWGGPTATGSGNALFHGCNPNCAAAPTHSALVAIRLSNVRTCGGRRYYAGLTLTESSGKLLDESFVQRPWSPC